MPATIEFRLARQLKEQNAVPSRSGWEIEFTPHRGTPMNAAHLHLVINHLPIVGALLSVPLVILALAFRAERGLLTAAAVTLTLTGAGALAALQTGEPAEEVVEHLPEVAETLIHEHEERAEVATGLAVATAVGALALFGMTVRRGAPLRAPWVAALLAATIATSGAMAWTGTAGGVIRHIEIRSDATVAAAAQTEQGDSDHD